jgi:hypothetical protein
MGDMRQPIEDGEVVEVEDEQHARHTSTSYPAISARIASQFVTTETLCRA